MKSDTCTSFQNKFRVILKKTISNDNMRFCDKSFFETVKIKRL